MEHGWLHAFILLKLSVGVWQEHRQLSLWVGPKRQPGDQLGRGTGYQDVRSGSGSENAGQESREEDPRDIVQVAS